MGGGSSNNNIIYYRLADLVDVSEIVGSIVLQMIDEVCYVYPNNPPYEICHIGSPFILVENNNMSFIRGIGVDFTKIRVHNGIICHNLEEYIAALFKDENIGSDEIKFIVEQIYNLPTITKEEYYNLIK